MSEPSLVLASGSPRRRELLRAAGLEFEIDPADVDEGVAPGTDPEQAALELAQRKACAVAERRSGGSELIIGSDTIVALEDRMLGKPGGPDEARGMLQALSESRHRVITGVAVVRSDTGQVWAAHERTWVTMRAITPEEVEAYVASGEWRGKAGGYAIQENADAFVTRLEEGGFDNVVGLPVALTLQLLEEARKA